ncbi:MAG: DUF5615 family PIN-like protein [Phycisphaerae bacterium]
MRILLDECVPFALTRSPAFTGHTVQDATRCGMATLKNGELRAAAGGRFDLLVTTDRHFKGDAELGPTPDMGIVVARVAPNLASLVVPAFESMARKVDLRTLLGKLVVVWRDHWRIS